MTKPVPVRSSKVSAIVMTLFTILGFVHSVQYVQKNHHQPVRRTVRDTAPPPMKSSTANRAHQAESGTGRENEPQRAARVARLNVIAVDGTVELQTLFLQLQLSDAERSALGHSTLLAGSDLYATQVRIENTGTIPLSVDPSKIRMHYGNQAVSVITIAHPSFLSATVLQPNHYISGLVVYRATLEVGAAIRLRGEGSYSYQDHTIQVTYDNHSE